AYGMCLALRVDAADEAIERAYATLLATRPTAVNLRWALDEMVAAVRNQLREKRIAAAYARAGALAEEDVAIFRALGRHGATLLATRPTAVNLRWALDEMVGAVRNQPRESRVAAAYARAGAIAEEDVAINRALGRHGATLIETIAAGKNGAPVNILTHCNAGW